MKRAARPSWRSVSLCSRAPDSRGILEPVFFLGCRQSEGTREYQESHYEHRWAKEPSPHSLLKKETCFLFDALDGFSLPTAFSYRTGTSYPCCLNRACTGGLVRNLRNASAAAGCGVRSSRIPVYVVMSCKSPG